MELNTLEIIAGVLIILTMLKVIILYTKPAIWLGSVKKLYTHLRQSSPIALLLAAIVLFFLINAGVRIVDILVVTLFIGLLACVACLGYCRNFQLVKNLNGLVRLIFRFIWI